MRAVLRTFVLTLFVALWLSAPAAAEPLKLVLLHFNDWDQMDNAGEIAAVINAEKAEAEADGATVLITFGGDLISPSLMSGIDQGAHMVELAEAIGVQFAAVGNHEFDFGPDVLIDRIAESDFPWLTSNVTVNGSAMPGIADPQIVEAGGFKIGILGLTTPDTAFLSSPGDTVAFEAYGSATARDTAALKERGADFVLVLSHGGQVLDRELVRTVGDIDLILGAHDHLARIVFDGRDMTAAAGAQGEFIARTTIVLDRVEKRGKLRLVWEPSFELIPTAGVTPDPTVQALVDGFTGTLDTELGQVIGKSESELDTRRASIRSMETGFGNLVTDALRAATDSDLALTNGGGIRGDTVYEPGTELTRKVILTELPFGNSTVKLEMTGAQLRAALEHGVSAIEDGAGRFPQVSGMTFSFDASKPVGSRIVDVSVNGASLDPAATYTLATNDYIAGGGDGYTPLAKAKVLIDADAGGLMAGQVIDYVRAAGTVTAPVEGRITRLD